MSTPGPWASDDLEEAGNLSRERASTRPKDDDRAKFYLITDPETEDQPGHERSKSAATSSSSGSPQVALKAATN